MDKHDIAHRATQDLRTDIGKFSGKIIYISKDETLRNPNWAQDVVYMNLDNITEVLERTMKEKVLAAYNAGAEAVLDDVRGTLSAARMNRNYNLEGEYQKHVRAIDTVVERLVL